MKLDPSNKFHANFKRFIVQPAIVTTQVVGKVGKQLAVETAEWVGENPNAARFMLTCYVSCVLLDRKVKRLEKELAAA